MGDLCPAPLVLVAKEPEPRRTPAPVRFLKRTGKLTNTGKLRNTNMMKTGRINHKMPTMNRITL